MSNIRSISIGPDHINGCRCGNSLYAQNTRCVACGEAVGFDPISQRVASFIHDPITGHWLSEAPEIAGQPFLPCTQRNTPCNCNWMLHATLGEGNCLSCQLTQTIPQQGILENTKRWGRAELAKRRILTQLLRLGLPVVSKTISPTGLEFKFMASLAGDPILTGHENGVITLNISEADDSEREAMREKMGEKYRTLAGHIRHELGHYYWERLSHDHTWLENFRSCFGDERSDYKTALQNHHQNGPPAGWAETYISAYAACHPWEDWAETFGHYLHLEEGLSLARHFGLEVNSLTLTAAEFTSAALPEAIESIERDAFIADINRWIRLSLLINELADGLGQSHPSPFVLNVAAVAKLWQVHSALIKLRI